MSIKILDISISGTTYLYACCNRGLHKRGRLLADLRAPAALDKNWRPVKGQDICGLAEMKLILHPICILFLAWK